MKSIFKNFIIAAALLFGAVSVSHAQVKIGTNPTIIDPSAVLHLESTNKGFLPPKVVLTGVNDAVTIPTPAKGLIVYHAPTPTSVTPLPEGLYVNSGTTTLPVWSKMAVDGSVLGYIKVGETRTGVVSITPNSIFFNGSGTQGANKPWMIGREAFNTTSKTIKLLSEAKGTLDGFPVFAGMRMDFSSEGSVSNASVAPKLVNTTSDNIIYSVSTLSTGEPFYGGGKLTIVPGAVSWAVDGNDAFTLGSNNETEYNNSIITIHKADGTKEAYNAIWTIMWIDLQITGVMSVTRLF